jgi:transposase
VDVRACRAKYKALASALTERARRIWAATEARAAGRGGITGVVQATGISYSTIQRGLKELEGKGRLAPGRIRRPGGGRKKTVVKDPTLRADLEGLVEPTASGDPMSPLRWTSKSVRHLAAALQRMGHQVSRQLVSELLATAGYSLQANRKTREGAAHADRDAQFRFINDQVRRFQAATQPVISVDTKKKELVGDFKNMGRDWRPRGQPTRVRVHDFLIPERGKAIPYGVYDLTRNAGWVSVGIDHDTATFAVRTIGRWWQKMGRPRYPRAHRVLITADAGGSNGPRVRLWKWELQRLANRTGLAFTVCHFPPGTSKWNKIEHRLFSYISTNWRGQPLVSLAVIVNLIGSTRTAGGLRVRCELDAGRYRKGHDISDAELATVHLEPHRFHGDWNYTIHPTRARRP